MEKSLFNFMNGIGIEKEEKVIEWEKEQERDLIKAYLQRSNIPSSYLSSSFDTFKDETPEEKEYKKNTVTFYNRILKDEYLSLVMTGEVGIGKTTLATATLIQYLNNYKINYYGETLYPRIYYVKSSDLVNEYHLSQSYSSAITPADVIAKYADYKLLCIDELARYTNEEDEVKVFYELLDARDNLKHPSIYVSNVSTKEFLKYIRVASRDRLRQSLVMADGTGMTSHRITKE